MSGRQGTRGRMEIFSGRAHPALALEIAGCLGIEPSPLTVSTFPDGEFYARIETSVRGSDVFLVQPTCPPVNDNFTELLIILDALRRASAGRVTAIVPYYGYARQDKKTAGREPITARMIADMLTRGGVDRLLTIDLHSAQIQGFFDIPVDHLTAVPVLVSRLREMDLRDCVIVAPDAGRVGMATEYANRLGLPLVIIHKRRTGPELTQVVHVVGEVEGRRPIIIDDMITTGGTVHQSVKALLKGGAVPEIRVAATHGVFAGRAVEHLSDPSITCVLATNTTPIPASTGIPKVSVVSVAPIIADAIGRVHGDQSVSDLFA